MKREERQLREATIDKSRSMTASGLNQGSFSGVR